MGPLTLPVEVFGTHTFYEGVGGGGGGVLSRPPMISEMVDSPTFNFGRPLGLCMRGKKTGGVDDLSLVRFPWQPFYLRVFSTKNG